MLNELAQVLYAQEVVIRLQEWMYSVYSVIRYYKQGWSLEVHRCINLLV